MTGNWPDETINNSNKKSKLRKFLRECGNFLSCGLFTVRCWVQKLVEHKYFQQGILLAILINTLSMGIEYHNQVKLIHI